MMRALADTLSRRGRTLVAVAYVATGIAVAETPITFSDTEDHIRLESTLPGPVLDFAIDPTPNPAPSILFLVRPFKDRSPQASQDCEMDATPLEIWRWSLDSQIDLESPGHLERIRDNVSSDVRRLHSVRGTTLVETPGALRRAVPDSDATAAQPVLSDPRLLPGGAAVGRANDRATGDVISVADLNSARFYQADPQGASWTERLAIDLHKQVASRRHGLRLVSRPPQFIGAAGSVVHFGTQPIALNQRRLRGQWVGLGPGVADGEVTHHEWWAGLPEPEEVLESAFLIVGGEPALLVTTRPFAKLALFGEKRLRLFRLREDRSRIGHPPFFATSSRINLWQMIHPYVRDLDGDGSEDLILAYWKGLKDSRIAIDVYPGDGAGGFSGAVQTTAFNVKDGDRSFVLFDADIDGDAIPDLLLRAGEDLLIHSGQTTSRRSPNVVNSKPSFRIALSTDTEATAGDADEGEIVISVGGAGLQSTTIGSPRKPHVLAINQQRWLLTRTPLRDGQQRVVLLRLKE